MECAPDTMSRQQMIQLTLDVSKAHRRILIDPKDGGMLCFHANGKLYRCITLNFGARAQWLVLGQSCWIDDPCPCTPCPWPCIVAIR